MTTKGANLYKAMVTASKPPKKTHKKKSSMALARCFSEVSIEISPTFDLMLECN
jgi:hypothetical protein